MITGLDHLVVLCASFEQGVRDYELMLGRGADWHSKSEQGGMESAFFQLDNTALELIAPLGNNSLAAKLRERVTQQGEGIQSLVFASDNIDEDHRVMARRALEPDAIQEGESTDVASGKTRSWRRFRLNQSATAGMRLFVLQRSGKVDLKNSASDADLTGKSSVSGLDHVVISTANPDRAAAIYAARLGLRFALDRSTPERDLRLQWFRAGTTSIEVAHKMSRGLSAEDDSPWGVTWKVENIEQAHQRLTKNGVKVSEIRQGFKSGTQVFTVRSHTCSVPSLFLAASSA